MSIAMLRPVSQLSLYTQKIGHSVLCKPHRLAHLIKHVIKPAITRAVILAVTLIAATLPQHSAAQNASTSTLTVSQDLANLITTTQFPLGLTLARGKVFLSKPSMLFLPQPRIGLAVKFQAYDHRPAQGIALSETGRAQISGVLDYDPTIRRLLIRDPQLEQLVFDRDNAASAQFRQDMEATWAQQVTNPIRTELPQHPFLMQLRRNLLSIGYDGSSILLHVQHY